MKSVEFQKGLCGEQFVLQAIHTLRKGTDKGIRLEASGLIEEYYKYFPGGAEMKEVLLSLAQEGVIVVRRSCKNDSIIYDAREAPSSKYPRNLSRRRLLVLLRM